MAGPNQHWYAFVVLISFAAASSSFADDLTVGWISRQPELEYTWNSANPAVEGWPARGEAVLWRAHVKNWSAVDRSDVAYGWFAGTRLIRRGTVSIPANGMVTVDLPWSWSFERHRISFVIDLENSVTEESEQNNRLEIFSDALAVGLWVEKSLYDFFRANQHYLGIGSTCWENWAQRLINFYNDLAALAVYPETPNGVLDRWRIQKIVVVPDGALPLVPLENHGAMAGEPNGSTHPNRNDRTVDLQWGFRAATLPSYRNVRVVSPYNPFYLAPSLLHELGHARYLTDVYAWNVWNAPPHYVIDIQEGGRTIVGEFIPGGPYAHYTSELGFMNEHFTFIDRYSAINLNQIAGHRAVRGNYNDPENVGSFLNDLPTQNRLTIRDPFGNLLTNAEVWIYQGAGGTDAWYSRMFDGIPDLRLRTDEKGQVLLGRCPFSQDGRIVHYWRGSNAVAIVRVDKAGRVEFGFLESRLFNLAHWNGQTELADHELTIGLFCANRGPSLRAPLWDARLDSPEVVLSWDGIPDASEYNIWASVDLGTPRLLGATLNTSFPARLAGQVYWWIEAKFPACAPRRSESGRFTTPRPDRQRPVRR